VLVIEDDSVRFEPADDIWGLDVMSTHDALKARFGERSRSMIIGPGGENLVRYAGIRSGNIQLSKPHRDGRSNGVEAPQGHSRRGDREVCALQTLNVSWTPASACVGSWLSLPHTRT
jgi:hypothetical protein